MEEQIIRILTKRLLSPLLCVPLLAAAHTASAQRTLVDDFSGSTIDFSKWRTFAADPEFETLREVANGRAVLKTSADGTGNNARTRLFPASTIPETLSGDVIVHGISAGAGAEVVIRTEGSYYNDASAAPVNEEGNIWASVRIGDRGNGLEAWWVIVRSDNPDFSAFSILNEGVLITPGTLTTGTAYSMSTVYDGNQTFTFSFNGISSGAQMGPARAGPAGGAYQGFANRITGGRGSIHASIDNANIDNGAQTDDFSSPIFNPAIWQNSRLETARIAESGKLRLDIRGVGLQPNGTDRMTQDIVLREINPDYIEAQVTVLSASDLDPGMQGRARLTGYFYNERRDGGVRALPYDGCDGDVWGRVQLQLQDGTLTANAYLESEFQDCNTADQELLFQDFTRQLQVSQEYLLWMQRDGNKIIFGVDDETIEHTITTPTYDPSTLGALEGYRRLMSRVQTTGASDPAGADGVFKALFDNIYVGGAAPASLRNPGSGSSSSPLGPLTLMSLLIGCLIRRRIR